MFWGVTTRHIVALFGKRHYIVQRYINRSLISQTKQNLLKSKREVNQRGRIQLTSFTVPSGTRTRTRTDGLLSKLTLSLVGFSIFTSENSEVKEEEEDPLIIMLKWARLYELRHDLQQASNHYHKALALLLEREQDEVWTQEQVLEGKVYIYAGMANVAFGLFRLDEAEKLYKETIKGLLQQNKQRDDDSVIEISLKLATIFTIQKRFDEASTGYEYCIKLLDNKLRTVNRETVRTEDPEDHSGNLNTLALLGMCTTAYGRFLVVQSKYSQAYSVLSNALVVAKQVFGEDDNQVAVLYNDLATVSSHLSDFVRAKEHAMSAIEVGRKLQSDDLAMFYCNLCFICLDSGQWEEGRKSGRNALRLAKNRDTKDLEQKALICLRELKEKSSHI